MKPVEFKVKVNRTYPMGVKGGVFEAVVNGKTVTVKLNVKGKTVVQRKVEKSQVLVAGEAIWACLGPSMVKEYVGKEQQESEVGGLKREEQA